MHEAVLDVLVKLRSPLSSTRENLESTEGAAWRQTQLLQLWWRRPSEAHLDVFQRRRGADLLAAGFELFTTESVEKNGKS